MRSVLRPTLIEPVRYVYPSYADYYGDVPYGEEENNPPAVVTPTDANPNPPVPVPVPVPAPPASPSTTGLMSLFTNMQRTTFIIIVLILLLFLCVMIK